MDSNHVRRGHWRGHQTGYDMGVVRIPPFVEQTIMIDMTPFRDIIRDWFDEREFVERTTFELLPDEDQIVARTASLLGKLKVVVWQLGQQGKDTKLLTDHLENWVRLDMLAGRLLTRREHREDTLYDAIEDYLNGQGYRTRG